MANLETWLAEENSIIQKADNEKQAYLHEWLERLDEHLRSGNATNVSPFFNQDVQKVLCVSFCTLMRLVIGSDAIGVGLN